jgi:hypothetical protein
MAFTIFNVNSLLSQSDLDAYLRYYPTIPSTSAIGQHGSFPTPSAYGQVPISIPLAEATMEGIRIPIALSYNTMGVKVNQNAGEIGLGWSMGINGFFIEQTVKGAIDATYNYNVSSNYSDFFERLAGDHFNPPSSLADPEGLQNDLNKAFLGGVSGTGYKEFGRDEYSYSFNGYSGKFLYDEDGSIINLSSSGNDLKIERILNASQLDDAEFVIPDD